MQRQKWEYQVTEQWWQDSRDFDLGKWMRENECTKKDFGWDEKTEKWDTDSGRTQWVRSGYTERDAIMMEHLNTYGGAGWELVSIGRRGVIKDEEGGVCWRAFWKRPIEG